MNKTILLAKVYFFSVCVLLGVAAISSATSDVKPHPSEKRVAVLYFEDKSNFDSPTGCGCIPNFVGKIFSTKKLWDLEAGFATILDRKLAETSVYQPVSRDALLDGMAQMSLSRHDLKKLNKAQRAELAKLLKADILVIGEIKKFGQSRMRGNASRALTESGREVSSVPLTTSYATSFAAMGHHIRATTELNVKFYEASGSEIASVPITASKNNSLAGTKVAGLEASITESGTRLRFGKMKEQHGKYTSPITKPTQLNKIKFASPEYDRTLLGIVTNEALIKTVVALRDNYGPNFITPWETPAASDEQKKEVDEQIAQRPIKITYIDTDDPDLIYINAGSAKGLAIDQEFAVYTDGEPIRDVDTGEILDYRKKKIATVSVTEILNNKLSIVKVVEKIGDMKRGDLLKPVSNDKVPIEQ